MIEYEFWLYNPAGQLSKVLDRFVSAYIERRVNAVGKMQLSLPWGAYQTSLFQDNCMLQAWRSIDSGPMQLVGQTNFFLQRTDKGLSSQGVKTLDLYAWDPLFFLSWRDIDYAAGTAYASKTGAADNVMKAYVRENMGSLATDAARNLEPYLTTQADASAAPSVSKAASHRDMMSVCSELAESSFTAGTYLAFDIVCPNPTSSAALEFRTYTGMRGMDHRFPSGQSPVILDPDNGNLTDCLRSLDNSSTGNAITAGGQGEENARVTRTALDAVSIGQSIWNRREMFIDARSSDDPNAVQAEANAALRANRKKTVFTGKFVPTPGIQFMREFDFGDYVTCVWDDESRDMRVDAFAIRIQDGVETPDIAFRSDT